MSCDSVITVAGGGLSGCEAAWQLAKRGFKVKLFEARPHFQTGAHKTDNLAELVCSNSLKTIDEAKPAGVLKKELEALDSLLISAAYASSVPAGRALAVDRAKFSAIVIDKLTANPNIEIIRDEITEIPEKNAIIATGPLTSPSLAESLGALFGSGLYFYDAIAPVVDAQTVDMEHAFFASRWGKGPGDDYLNCPLNEAEYLSLVEFIRTADSVEARAFEDAKFFESCLPVEVMASRGLDVLRYGPLRPVGIFHPVTDKRPYAVVQLRAENLERTAYNLVGFQTRMKYPEQKKMLALIPALRNAEILKYGEIHRNLYINAPEKLARCFALPDRENVFITGLLTGMEGYVESIATGALSGIQMACELTGKPWSPPPRECALGAICWWLENAPQPYTPTNINFGLWPPVVDVKHSERHAAMVKRANESFKSWKSSLDSWW